MPLLTEMFEDSYYPPKPEDDSKRREEELSAFVEKFIENDVGIPPGQFSVWGDTISMSVPRKPVLRPMSKSDIGKQKEWYQAGMALIDELRIAEFGDYEVATNDPYHVSLAKY